MKPEERNRRIWQVVGEIPEGQVMSYGEVARRAGLGRAARLVGKALQAAPKALALPWHRVLRADGSIAFPAGSRAHREQSRRLRQEGVRIESGKVRESVHVDKASMDKLLWSME